FEFVKKLIWAGIVAAVLAGGYCWLARGLAGGGGSTQTAPDVVKTGEPATVKIDFSVWGAGASIKGQYTDVRFYYRLVGEPSQKLLTAVPAPIVFTGGQSKFNGMYESYAFTIPPYPKGTRGEIEYACEFKFGGHFN